MLKCSFIPFFFFPSCLIPSRENRGQFRWSISKRPSTSACPAALPRVPSPGPTEQHSHHPSRYGPISEPLRPVSSQKNEAGGRAAVRGGDARTGGLQRSTSERLLPPFRHSLTIPEQRPALRTFI